MIIATYHKGNFSINAVNRLVKPVMNTRTKYLRGCKISPSKKQAAPKGAACKIFLEEGLVQWKNQPFGGII